MRLAIVTSPGDAPRAADCSWPDGATLADLATACGEVRAQRPVTVDGTTMDPSTPLAQASLRRGSCVDLTGAAAPPPPASGAALVITGGIGAGTAHLLPLSPAVLGRAPQSDLYLPDPTVARTQAVLTPVPAGAQVAVTPAPGATNPIRIDGREVPPAGQVLTLAPDDGHHPTIAIGAVRAEIRVAAARTGTAPGTAPGAGCGPSGPDPDGRVPWHRPPRHLGTGTLPEVVLPNPPAPSPAIPFSWTGTLTPVVVGLGLAVVLSPMMALFALLSPVYALGTWGENRRRRRAERRAAARFEHAALTEALATAQARHRAERAGRRGAAPGPGALAQWIRTGSPRLWERRPGHPDFLSLRVGLADLPFAVDPFTAADLSPPGRAHTDAALADLGPLSDVPVVVGAAVGGLIGVCGPRVTAVAVARALVVQAATLHGPGDLAIAVVADAPDAAAAWDWIRWLPHHRTDATAPDALVEAGARRFLVVDGGATASGLPPDPCGVAIAGDSAALPAACAVIVRLDGPLGAATVEWIDGSRPAVAILADGMPAPVADELARAMARWSDPATAALGAALPPHLDLVDLLSLPAGPDALADHTVRSWSASGTGRTVAATVGWSAEGPLALDLVADGPHALVAGTTGAGKSELLRTLVASIALAHAPTDVTFLLIDYKGGSAFDACVDLPHVVGVITDLDPHLARRALTALDAEIRHREELLRRHGSDDVVSYRTTVPAPIEPLPRLVVVIDEFATLARELPHFLTSLVSIGQRGRSLGIHLVLATQRPSGVVNDQIRTNTNLRIALRLLDATDAADLVGTSVPATLRRDQPGRAVVRRDDADAAVFQTALVTGPARHREASVRVRFADTHTDTGTDTGTDTDTHSDADTDTDAGAGVSALAAIVAACRAGARRLGIADPRRPWIDPLPHALALAEVPPGAAGLADDPDRQRRSPWSWSPGHGPLLVYGMPGSGTTSALCTIAAATVTAPAPGPRPRPVELHVVDLGTGELAALSALPHTANMIRAHEPARIHRLIDWLSARLDQPGDRHDDLGPSPAIVVLIDGLGALIDTFEGLDGMRRMDRFERVWREGHGVGIHLAATADRPAAVPAALAAATAQRLVLRLADPHDLVAAGVPPTAASRPGLAPVPGRGIAVDGLEVQLAHVTAHDLTQLARHPAAPPAHRPHHIGELPPVVDADRLPPVALADPWRIPLAIRDDTLGPAELVLHRGDHALVAGPARSGVSTVLAVATARLRAAGAHVLVVAPRPSPLTAACADAVAALDGASVEHLLAGTDRPTAVVIDDADRVADTDGCLAALLDRPDPHVRVIAGGRTDRLRGAYGHWTTALRASRCGLALLPDPDVDGDLWGVRLPRPAMTAPSGRGFLIVDGQSALVQAAA